MGGTAERGNGNGTPGGGRLALSSEFATVHVWVDLAGNGPRLTVEDQHNGNRIYLDPLELASLTWLKHEDLGPFLDPSRTGWRDAAPEAGPETGPEVIRDAGLERAPGAGRVAAGAVPGAVTPHEVTPDAAEAGGQQQ